VTPAASRRAEPGRPAATAADSAGTTRRAELTELSLNAARSAVVRSGADGGKAAIHWSAHHMAHCRPHTSAQRPRRHSQSVLRSFSVWRSFTDSASSPA